MSKKLVDSGIKWIGEIPFDWKISKIKWLGRFINGYAFKPDDWGSNGLPIIRIQNLTDSDKEPNYFDGELDKKYLVTNGDYLISWSATLNVFKWEKGNAFLNQHIFKVILNEQNVEYNFFYWLAKVFMEEMNSSKHGSTMQHVTKSTFDNFKVPLPNIKIQSKIAAFLDNKILQIDCIIEKTKQSIKELKKYKQSLITETVTKGLDPNVEMKNSETSYIGDIPFNWNISRIRYLGFLQNGISKSGEYFGSGHPFVSYSDVYKNIELPKNVDGLVESTNEERERYSVRKGDVFFTRTSETIQEVGFASTCMEEVPGAVFAGFVIRFRPETQELNPAYAKYYFRSEIHRKFFVKEMNIVTRASLSQGLLKRLPVLLPSQEEQREISQFLDEKCYHIDSLIEKKQKIIAEMESYKKSLIYEYVTGKKEVV
ncbi:restriction endonuclease subunit S [Virgibacillus salexigens]|uniref:restriction endonuclease subunit S n=1 Tax=Virgibacillus salexigens TaxID=61016 RepID=UPI00190CECC8|nr:restriction endonuclease subunit S [Virgibacillus salexigens]